LTKIIFAKHTLIYDNALALSQLTTTTIIVKEEKKRN